MMKKIYSLSVCFCCALIALPAQHNDCLPTRTYTADELAFQSGERLTVIAAYKWGLINMDVGEATFTLQDETFRGVHYFFARGVAKTYKFWDNFFEVRDIYEGRFRVSDLRPIYFHRDIKEGGYKMKNTYLFNFETNEINATIQSQNNPMREYNLEGKPCTFDIISLFYNSRNLDFSGLTPGKTFPISFAIDEKIYDLYYRYVGVEEVKISKQGTFRCLKFKASLVAGEVFTGKEELTIWITDDKNRMPVMMESPVIVGRVTIRLGQYANLKHPLTSKIR